MRFGVALAFVVVACSSKDKPAVAPPPAPPRDAAVADAAVVLDGSAPAVESSMLDACDQVYIEATATARALLFSCLGVAIDLPRGMSADGGPRDLDGVVVEIMSVGAADDGEVALAGRIDAVRAEFEPSLELASPETETIIQIDGDELRGTAVAPAKRAPNRVYRVFRDGERSGLRASVMTADGLHTLRFNFVSQLSPAALERRVAPLLKVRPMTANEIKLAPLPADMKPVIVDRVLPLEKDSGNELVLCPNGTYQLTRPLDDIAARGTWRMSLNTLWISHKHFLAGGVYDDGLGSIHLGMFGKTASKPPFPAAGERCGK